MTAIDTDPLEDPAARQVIQAPQDRPVDLERRGRWWLIVSFLACPCHLPLTLGLLGVVLGGTAVGALLRDHVLVAGLVIGAAWLAGTARGFVLIRRAQRGELTCPLPDPGKATA